MDVYQCKSCGRASQEKEKLCSPEKRDGFGIICDTCGKPAKEKGDVCNPVEAK